MSAIQHTGAATVGAGPSMSMRSLSGAIVVAFLVPLSSGCEFLLASASGGGSGDGVSVAAGGATGSSGATAAAPASASSPSTTGTAPAGTVAPAQALGVTHRGEATYYGATGAGHCSFDPTPDDLMVAAMNAPDYANSAVCGQFVEVTGPLGKAVVRIVDSCPECRSGDLDLSPQAFARIANLAAGRVPITWQVVPGDVQGPVSYRYKEGSTRFWTAIQVRNHRVPITRLELLPGGATAWIDVPRLDYNYFVHPSPIPAGAVQVRVTAVGGATIRNMLPEPQGGMVIAGTAQFP